MKKKKQTRRELQRTAKVYGIPANKRSDYLRAQIAERRAFGRETLLRWRAAGCPKPSDARPAAPKQSSRP